MPANSELIESVIEALPVQMAVLDPTGTIMFVNAAWNAFSRENGAPSLAETSVGRNYLAASDPTVDQPKNSEESKNMSNEHKEHISPNNVWNSSEAAENWQQGVTRRQQDMGEATQLMLEAAGLEPGDHVLDIAAGTGDQSLLAARIVGSDGSVLATDISVEMLNIAARLAQQEGLTNVTTRVMDAEQLDLQDTAFDAVICRFGLMLLPHPQQAMREIRRVLKPGGKLAALVWSKNPLFSVSLTIAAKYMPGASLHAPNPFTFADPAVFERELTGAGFREVMTEPIPFHAHYASIEAFLQSSGNSILAGAAGQLSQQDQQHLLVEERRALSQFEGPQGLVAPGEMLLGVGTR